VIVTPLGDRVRFGGTLELSGFDERLDPERYRAVVIGGRSVLRDSPVLANEEPWYGFRPLTPDGLPVIGRVPALEGLLIATGHAMLGFTQAPATGRLIADLARGQRWPIDIEMFRPDRF
jgi:D-amino-acid dehydrogenase